ncbi:alcohol dehydrogenase [Pseudomonas putida]|jgi:quinohemoprotein ethanol dehydrogenase|uniref:Quinohemoprotein alcohol dehydrogenase ADH IIB n=3 Tax=Pseudomonas TaxID=286 RepID=QHED_PSEPU|nr:MULTISPECIES: PQQ-dependent dehydrogenase, methanol/ethanol family [Pseudomonas]Q8GR64.1 RecName: Full=Quinohemoprotein alcohol dehydrogenase ADH IIB; Short=ADH IIB; AltName: Full=Alcohol dehydrogenase (azurin); Flags: Precursor [Pseudomonas putida]KTC22457.1 alcohol dehydrogenase [Pseudomonas putida]OUM25914.1 PQQ-dependent dehydrogenase, methanol/ethanol family [Pseudomonas sp. 1239]PPS63716.1 PQQ-dependent dehydrogenase, methanol/ethanol family [Pseudomonas sp. BRM28]PPS64258.1 PQQ-depen
MKKPLRTSLLMLCLATPLAALAAGVDEAAIRATEQAGGEWLSHGRTYAEQRFSPLKQIDASNVRSLGLAWYMDLDNTRGLEATPLFHDGVIYTSMSWSRVIAVDAASGKELWRYDPEVAKVKARTSCCDAVNRGVALWGDKVYVGTLDGRLIALDAKTGKAIWSQQTTDPAKPYSITGAPRVVKGKVIIGNGGAEYGVRGFVSAYDADTGKLAWRFYTVPGDPALPYEHPELREAAKTWQGDQYWKLGGGGTVWDSMAYDPELDLLYVGTGNGSPWNREVRSPGGGDNLYLSSILAIRPDTGKLAWHYQVTPGDSWDFTATQQITLAELNIDGKPRKVLMQAPKNGFFYVLDRTNGKLISAEKFGKVTWAEKVDLATGRPVEAPGVRYEKEPIVMWPSPFGAHNWHSMSFNPGTGLVYIPYQEVPGVYRNEGKDFVTRKAFNTAAGFADATDVPAAVVSGALLAWDPVKQKAAWKVPYPTHWNGGTLSTAGNLVFQGTAAGQMHAYSADKGEALWQFEAQSGIVAAPMTFELAGRQYVAIMAGWGGVATLTGGESMNLPGMKNRSRLLVFALDGKAQLPPPAPAPAKVERVPQPVTAAPEQVQAGKQLYGQFCSVCHGMGTISGGLIPDLRQSSDATREHFQQIVLQGALKPLGMPSFDDSLKPEEVEQIKLYVMSREYEDYMARHKAAP